jgi:hypothetical protein
MWRVYENIVNKQSRTGDMGWYSSLNVGRRVYNRKTFCAETCIKYLKRQFMRIGGG